MNRENLPQSGRFEIEDFKVIRSSTEFKYKCRQRYLIIFISYILSLQSRIYNIPQQNLQNFL